MSEERFKTLLLVEDNAADVRLMREMLRGVDPSIQLHVATDGLQALAMLRRERAYFHVPRPDLILLDLDMPVMDGRELLAHLKVDDRLKTIPTVILTNSEEREDIARGYQLQANVYLNKPVQLDAFEALVRSINDFWLTKATLPQEWRAA